MSHLTDIVAAVREALGTIDGLHDVGLLPANPQKSSSKLDKGYAVGIPSSNNTPQSRDRSSMVVTHAVLVRLANVVKPRDHVGSYSVALEDGERIVKAVLTSAVLEGRAGIEYVSTSRTLAPSGDYVYSAITFRALTCASLFD